MWEGLLFYYAVRVQYTTMAYRYSCTKIPAKKQIAAMLTSEQAQIDVKMMNVQRQEGGSDCGLFAIAFATALVNGIQPASSIFTKML